MRQLTAAFLLALSLCTTTECLQLLKLPVLLEHYSEHKQLDRDLTVTGFFRIHYASGNVVDKDYEKDMQLPFKSDNCHMDITAPVFLPQTTWVIKTPVRFVEREYTLQKQHQLPVIFTSNVWQPPRGC